MSTDPTRRAHRRPGSAQTPPGRGAGRQAVPCLRRQPQTGCLGYPASAQHRLGVPVTTPRDSIIRWNDPGKCLTSGCSPETTRWERHVMQGGGRGAQPPAFPGTAPGRAPPCSQPRSSPNPTAGQGCLWRLNAMGIVGHRWLKGTSSPLLSPEGGARGWKFQPSNCDVVLVVSPPGSWTPLSSLAA